MSFTPAKLEAELARLDGLLEGPAREAAREVLSGVLELHREGLKRLLERLPNADFTGDELVESLLFLHDLHPRGELEHIDKPLPDPTFVPLERLTKKHERCELCSEALGAAHDHLFDVDRRKLQCACTACVLLFDRGGTKLKRVESRITPLAPLAISDAQWQALKVPVGLAFFSRSSSLGEVIAAYPGPAGAIESIVAKEAWEAVARDNDVLGALEPDVSAVWVDRLNGAASYHLLSIDVCYRLTALVRSKWQGMTGGDAPRLAVRELLRGRP